ncbi:TetR/AcrR family transcriptional regulator [Sneathiella limimaris]|uniref:TetR/AcrR family transcriptional regulator n=1 Tax=Sneathiella limimaris TaxID=1964213 RepID=UPI00146E06A8|nr:TetR/AcrR family transcriptional regulator [Sneathiella limimaris]
MPKVHPERQNQLRAAILKAARHRYLTQSPRKTTLEEVAEDCGITAPHLYNFYKSKLDLAEAVAVSILEEWQSKLAEVLDQEGSAKEVLQNCFEQEIELTIEAAKMYPGYVPLMEIVLKKRERSFARAQRRYLRPLSLYLDHAMARGEVVRQDPFWVAETLHLATHAFRNEFVTKGKDFPDLKQKLNDVMSLMLEGVLIKKEPSAGKAEG